MATPQKPSLPTLDRLGVHTLPPSLSALSIAKEWFSKFSSALQSKNPDGVLDLLLEDVFWRDILALTWTFRSFQGTTRVRKFLEDVTPNLEVSQFALQEGSVTFDQPYPDLAWIQGFFSFESEVVICSGIFRIVPTPPQNAGEEYEWKAHAVFTHLEDLKGHPEKIGSLREQLPDHGTWKQKRQREINFEEGEPQPTVVIVGGGQSGLDVASRLKFLGVPTLVAEKYDRIGDNWRLRYDALCLHDVVWYDHMPYLPFPPSWPVYTPAAKLADWLESYAHSMELNVWTSSTVTSAVQKLNKDGWTVTITKKDGTTRVFEPRHVIFAIGIGHPNVPIYPGQDEFKGIVMHSSKHHSAKDHIGKKVVVVGACTSGHDIAHDYYNNGVDITMYQRSSTYIMTNKNGMPRLLGPLYWEGGPPTDVADRINASYPNHLMKLMHYRVTKDIAEADKELLDALQHRGFRTNLGEDDSGFLFLAWKRAGGYYLDVGASQLIADGKIKLKNDSLIKSFTSTGLLFEDGSTLDADVVIFATGYGDQRVVVRQICGDDVADRTNQIWGLDEEGEINSAWRWSGVEGLWFMLGNLALCRFHSKHLALQIKAAEEGVLGKAYRS